MNCFSASDMANKFFLLVNNLCMRMKISCFLLFLLCFTLASSACAKDNTTPLNVVFKNATLLGSENYTLTIVYAEDKRIREYSTDVLIKTNAPTRLKITKEVSSSWDVTLENIGEWQSLTNLINENLTFATFATVQTTTYIINSSSPCILTFKVIGGDLNEDKISLVNTFDVSKEFSVACKKTVDFK